MGSTDHLTVVEVCPRDGLQNEQIPLTVDQRIALIDRLTAAGAQRIEAVSFVNPARVPQMANAEEVIAGVSRDPHVKYSALVLNRRGAERALTCDIDEINIAVPATDGMSQANQNTDVSGMLSIAEQIVSDAVTAGVPTCGTVAVAFGCPFEGTVSLDQVRIVTKALVDAGIDEIAFADTIGVGVPSQVSDLIDLARTVAPGLPMRFHFHNTRNTGYVNAFAALSGGVRVLDAAAGGFGGCPFSPQATGNIATEDLDYLAVTSGFQTGLDRAAIADAASWVGQLLDRDPPAMVGRAGAFPPSS